MKFTWVLKIQDLVPPLLIPILQALLEEWDIANKLGVITSDSAANMLGIYKTVGFPSTYSCGQCANHLLQRVIEVIPVMNLNSL